MALDELLSRLSGDCSQANCSGLHLLRSISRKQTTSYLCPSVCFPELRSQITFAFLRVYLLNPVRTWQSTLERPSAKLFLQGQQFFHPSELTEDTASS